MTWKIGSNSVDPNSHTHTNKTTLDKFGETGGSPTFNGSLLNGGGGSNTYITGKKINCLGDSLTAGNTGGATPWVNMLQTVYGATIARNYGMSGTTLANNGSANGMVTRYLSMDNDADIIIVWGGFNDINQGIALGTFDDRVETTFYGALHVIVNGLQTKYVGKKIFIATSLDGYHSNWTQVKNMNNAVREVTEYYGTEVLEMSRVGINGRNADIKTALIPDGTHPNTAGNQIISDYIAKFINSH